MLEALETIKPLSNDSTAYAAGVWVINLLLGIGLFASLTIFLTSKEDKFVRLHALQAALFHISFILASSIIWGFSLIAIFILALITGGLGAIGVFIIVPLLLLIAILAVILSLYCGYRAYKGEVFLLPILGKVALKFA